MSSEVEIRAPAEQTEGTRSQILRWLKSVGESVTENEPLIELETDKVTVEVPSPGSGTLREILKQEQDEIGPGDLLGRIEAAGAVPQRTSQAPPTTASVAGHESGCTAVPCRRSRRWHVSAARRCVNAESAQMSSGATSAPNEAAESRAHNLSPAVRRLLRRARLRRLASAWHRPSVAA